MMSRSESLINAVIGKSGKAEKERERELILKPTKVTRSRALQARPQPTCCCLTAALAYRRTGLSFIPISADGRRRPLIKWKCFQLRQPRKSEIRSWFQHEGNVGLAIIAGEGSGGLEIIDVDVPRLIEPFIRQVHAASPRLLRKLVIVRSPRPGMHVYYRSPEVGKCTTLAARSYFDLVKKRIVPKALIELKGHGGTAVAPPSPPACHKSGKPYVVTSSRSLCEIQTITKRERSILINVAKSFDQRPAQAEPKAPPRTPLSASGRSGGSGVIILLSWRQILEPHGWRLVRTMSDGTGHWVRPGKTTQDTSATTNYGGRDLLTVFSANAEPFEPGRNYTKWAAIAILEHRGDFGKAARALKKLGSFTDSGA